METTNKLLPEYFKGNHYVNINDCALCRLFRRLHPDAGYVSAGSDTVGGNIGTRRVDYSISREDADRIDNEFCKPEESREGFEITLIEQ